MKAQIEYYRARAPEYDDWFLRRGRYDRGPEANADWFAEIALVRAALDAFHPEGDILELACGTGLWTEPLLGSARTITAVDAVAEVLELNRERVHSDKVRYVQADLFAWRPDALYDTVFFGFWLSHVPPTLFEAFWGMVGSALKPGGRAFFVDSQYEPASTARDHQLGDPGAGSVVRRLNDGSEFRIVKVFYRAEDLAARLQTLGWTPGIRETPHYFIYGEGDWNTR
ncbi:MAG: methyltransferase domain-containing protein [Anaerolineales bacterium]|nr:methyltransferase domain-containing protein [Anaerolineales bacterium]